MNSQIGFLKSVLFKGLSWSFLSTSLVSTISLIYYILITRYIKPEDFGIYSLSLVFIGFSEFFSGAGMSAVFIQKKKINNTQLSTFFWLNIIIGLLFTILFYTISPYIAIFFRAEYLTNIFRLMSFSILINSLSLLHNNILRKEIRISILEKIEITASIIMILTGSILAINNFGVISLALAFILSRLFISIAYLWFGKQFFLPKYIFQYSSVSSQINLGSYQIAEKFFNYIRANIDKLLIGRYFGNEALGNYTLALKTVEFPYLKLNPALNKVLFPYFSRLQDRPKIIAKLYANVITFLTITVTPLLIFVIFYAKEIVLVLFDASYQKVAVLIQIFSVLGLLRSFSNIGGNVLNSLGKFKVGFYWNLIWSASLTLILLVSLQFDIELTAFALIVFLANFVSFFAWHAIIYRFIQMPYKTLITRFLAVSIISFIIVYGLKTLKNQWLNAVPESFMLVVTFGLVTFLTALIAFLFLKNHKNLSFPVWK